jgi:hypothetical protein
MANLMSGLPRGRRAAQRPAARRRVRVSAARARVCVGPSAARTKADAQAKGRQMGMKAQVEHHIHMKDGTIGRRNSYGNDPLRSNG